VALTVDTGLNMSVSVLDSEHAGVNILVSVLDSEHLAEHIIQWTLDTGLNFQGSSPSQVTLWCSLVFVLSCLTGHVSEVKKK